MASVDHRAAYLYAVEPELITMMQQCASGAKLRTAGPLFRKVHRPCCSSGPRCLGLSELGRLFGDEIRGVYSSPCLDRGATCCRHALILFANGHMWTALWQAFLFRR
jgi:hypothetical protein